MLTIIFLFTLIRNLSSQDIHFSQFNKIPLFTNPANTGILNKDFRVGANYRNQWRTVDRPFETYNFAFDMNRKLFGDFIGTGAYIIHDLSGSKGLTVDNLFLSLGYFKFIGKHQFSIGIQPGFVFKSFDDHLVFDDQYDPVTGTFDPNLPGSENQLLDNTSYYDMNIGFLWRSKLGKYFPSVGISFYHITNPKESFISLTSRKKIPARLNISGSIAIPLTSKVDVIPSLNYSRLQGSDEFLAGTELSLFRDNRLKAVNGFTGFFYFRSNLIHNIDALIVGGSVDILGFNAALSYDLNVSTLRKASKYYGAFEISLYYEGLFFNSKSPDEPCRVQ